jgi:hypothetical protein
MPRYFFHTEYGAADRDDEGVVLPDDGAARVQAAKLAGMCIADEPHQLRDDHDCRVVVTDEHDVMLFMIITRATSARRV